MCLKVPFEEDIVPGIKPSYTQMLKMSKHLVEEYEESAP